MTWCSCQLTADSLLHRCILQRRASAHFKECKSGTGRNCPGSGLHGSYGVVAIEQEATSIHSGILQHSSITALLYT